MSTGVDPRAEPPTGATDSHAAGASFDLVIVGAGIAGVLALHYARQAGLDAVVLEREDRIGGLWARLPPWQDLQIAAADWTLGDIPMHGTDQASVVANVRAWVDRFDLASSIRLGEGVLRARRTAQGWEVATAQRTYRARCLLAATGAHNRPVVPDVPRRDVALSEHHSSALRDPAALAGRDVVVVGAGASALDLLDLCFEHGARRVVWVCRRTRWMVPTLKPKGVAGSVRGIASPQMDGADARRLSRAIEDDARGRYERLGLQDILPERPLDLRRDQLMPGRFRMIADFARIERHRAEVRAVEGRSVVLSDGASVEADVLLWGTGYEMDLGWFESPGLAAVRSHDALARQCGGLVRHLHEPGLYFLSVGLESTGSAPFNYAHCARSIVAEIVGRASLGDAPCDGHLNYFDVPRYLALRDPLHYRPGWEAEYRAMAGIPPAQPLPIPEWGAPDDARRTHRRDQADPIASSTASP